MEKTFRFKIGSVLWSSKHFEYLVPCKDLTTLTSQSLVTLGMNFRIENFSESTLKYSLLPIWTFGNFLCRKP